MPTPAFPTLTAKPNLPLKQKYVDSVLRNKMESGYEITRQRHGRNRREWEVNYPLMSAADFASFDTFVMTTVGPGAVVFTWSHPVDAVVYSVRFSEPPEADTAWIKGAVGYSVQFKLREV